MRHVVGFLSLLARVLALLLLCVVRLAVLALSVTARVLDVAQRKLAALTARVVEHCSTVDRYPQTHRIDAQSDPRYVYDVASSFADTDALDVESQTRSYTRRERAEIRRIAREELRYVVDDSDERERIAARVFLLREREQQRTRAA
jgi:hypothetical protein